MTKCALCGEAGADMDFNYAAPPGYHFAGGGTMFRADIHLDWWGKYASDTEGVLAIAKQKGAQDENDDRGSD